MNTYFRLEWDPDFPNPWWLGKVVSETNPIDCRIFTYGVKAEISGPLQVPITDPGTELELTFAAFSVPIATRKIADIFEKLAAECLQRFPVRVGECSDRYEVLNVFRTFEAIDRQRSVFALWEPQDGRPDKLGTFRKFDRMLLRRDIEPPPHLFRLSGWEVALVVSDTLMDALGGTNLRGVKFYPLEQ